MSTAGKTVAGIGVAVLLLLTAGIVFASSRDGLFNALAAIWARPWGMVTLLHLYAGPSFAGAWRFASWCCSPSSC